MLTENQKAKLVSAVQPLYQDPEFAGVTDILAEVTMTPPVVSETDSLDIPAAAELPVA